MCAEKHFIIIPVDKIHHGVLLYIMEPWLEFVLMQMNVLCYELHSECIVQPNRSRSTFSGGLGAVGDGSWNVGTWVQILGPLQAL